MSFVNVSFYLVPNLLNTERPLLGCLLYRDGMAYEPFSCHGWRNVHDLGAEHDNGL